MNLVTNSPAERTDVLRGAVRDVRVQLSVLNHHVAARAGVKDADFDCLDLISIHGPLSPGALSKLAELHPATLTGILDRLESGGWIARERDPQDRRAVVVRVLPDRNAEVFALYAGMNSRFDEICADFSADELDVIAGFLERVRAAGAAAAADLRGADSEGASQRSV
ncbi:MarR family winged helix-turn-helix transcriptional regulator [Leifsonia sp. 22587]|uniref:MarR family winged helix-turn-helix transcriptional regulator n=1 Tax=Leifsonia sp. 22587 TaxID=3453946 RepID=UPI003F86B99A